MVYKSSVLVGESCAVATFAKMRAFRWFEGFSDTISLAAAAADLPEGGLISRSRAALKREVAE